MYLVSIIDVYSRKVLSWQLSNTMDAHFCTAALEEAIVKYGVPSIFNVSKAVNSLQRHFFACCKTMVSRSVWMEKIGRSIISIKPSTNGLDKGAQLRFAPDHGYHLRHRSNL